MDTISIVIADDGVMKMNTTMRSPAEILYVLEKLKLGILNPPKQQSSELLVARPALNGRIL